MSNVVNSYGWTSGDAAYSSGYLEPVVLDLLRRAGVQRVLDVGAGNGHLSKFLADRGFDMVGMEYDAGGVAIAKRSYPEIPFYQIGVQDDPERLLTREERFDAVVTTEVIEHLFSPHLLPIFARSVLKPNGTLIVSTPYHGYIKNLAIALLGKWDTHHTALWHGGHIKFWSRATLSELLTQQGFEVTGFQGVGRLPYLWKSMLLVAKLRPDGASA